jgi:hypothetical protein
VKFIGTGESMLSRSDVVKKMWCLIYKHIFFPYIPALLFFTINLKCLAFSIHINRVVQSFKLETLCEP